MDQKPALTLGFTHSLDPVQFSLKMANRHGLIAGATGTGKTVTLQTMVEGFSKFGVPVCVPDIKGDLAGLAAPGVLTPKIAQRFETLGASFEPEAASVVFWDFGGKSGHPLRTTVSEIGPLLMSKLLGLNETQEGVLSLAFHIADTEKLLLLDIEDLDSVLDWIEENIPALRAQYGTISKREAEPISSANPR
jgi:uncharacterized protein